MSTGKNSNDDFEEKLDRISNEHGLKDEVEEKLRGSIEILAILSDDVDMDANVCSTRLNLPEIPALDNSVIQKMRSNFNQFLDTCPPSDIIRGREFSGSTRASVYIVKVNDDVNNEEDRATIAASSVSRIEPIDITSIQNYMHGELDRYFLMLDGDAPTDLHRLVMSQVESALTNYVLDECRGNQSKAACWLGISRGTLRGKLHGHHKYRARDTSDITSIQNYMHGELERYFEMLDGDVPTDLHRLVMSQVESALINYVLNECRGNQGKAACWLGISRGTLRGKLENMPKLRTSTNSMYIDHIA